MISSSTWVPRGFAAEFPEQYELDDAEMERIEQMAKLELNDANEELESAVKQSKLQSQLEIDDDLKKFDLETYDDDTLGAARMATLPGLSAEVQYQENEEGEAFITLPDNEDLAEQKEELQIYPTDNLILATRTEDEVSYLDVYVYDDGAGAPEGAEEEEGDKADADVARGMVREGSLYVHHDLMLPAFPLCVEWLNVRPGTEDVANFAAVGTFEPEIEIWNLDCVDKAFPDVILGEGKGRKRKRVLDTHHIDAVLSLAHNRSHRNVLASLSADGTVKLWDLTLASVAKSFNNVHSRRTVLSVQWHASESSILLTGGYNGSCAVSDIRVAEEAKMSQRYKVGLEDVETARWGAQPEVFYCGTDSGNVYCFDVRNQDKPLWTLHAHDTGISLLEVNMHIPGMLITSAMNERVVKMWRCTDEGPSMTLSRDFTVGNVLTASFASDVEVAGHMTVGGTSGPLTMWDAFSNKSVRSAFGAELRELQKRARLEAQKVGRALRLARKYQGDGTEAVLSVRTDGFDEEEED